MPSNACMDVEPPVISTGSKLNPCLAKIAGIAADIKGTSLVRPLLAEPYSGQFGCPKRPKYGEKMESVRTKVARCPRSRAGDIFMTTLRPGGYLISSPAGNSEFFCAFGVCGTLAVSIETRSKHVR